MNARSSTRDDMVWALVWWAIALVVAILVFSLVSVLIADDPAAGLIFGSVAFVVVGGLMVRFGPGPGPNQEVWHDPDAHADSMTHSAPVPHPTPAAPVHEPVARTPVADAPVASAPVVSVPEPVAPIAPVAAPVAGVVESETPPPGTGISERVRSAARAAGAMAADLSAPAAAPARPAALDAPEAGGADDLKKIKGVGPKLEELLHTLGIFHFGQIAAWGAPEIAWMDSNLEGFFGRVTRDDWVGQAKILGAGGETEFSKRVDEGDVY